MLKQTIQDRINELENERFYLAMKDRWTPSDYQTDATYCNEINQLKKMLIK
jgi:hypothetical protein